MIAAKKGKGIVRVSISHPFFVSRNRKQSETKLVSLETLVIVQYVLSVLLKVGQLKHHMTTE
jgi:hypothetical protein